jgi:hypothetical protein
MLMCRDAASCLGYVASASPPVAVTLSASDGGDPLPHHVAALVRADGGVTIELHHKLGDSYSPLDFDAEGLWDRAVPCTAGQVACLRPSNEDLMAHVCLHFLIDRVRFFSRHALAQLADVAAILDTFADTLEWDTVTRDATTRGYTSGLALALGTAAVVLDATPNDAPLSALAQHSLRTPDVSDLVAPRHPALVMDDTRTQHLAPTNGATPSSPKSQTLATGPRRIQATVRKLDGYARWMSATTRILLHP